MIEMTMNTYSHAMPEMFGATARAMDAALEDRPAAGPNLVPLDDPETPMDADSEADEAAEG